MQMQSLVIPGWSAAEAAGTTPLSVPVTTLLFLLHRYLATQMGDGA